MPRTEHARKRRLDKQSEYGLQRNKFFWAHKAIHTMCLSELEEAMRAMERMYPDNVIVPNPRWAVCYRQRQKIVADEQGQTVEQTFGQPARTPQTEWL